MKKSSFIARFFKKYSQSWVLLYFLIYLPWFAYLEKTVSPGSHYNLIYSPVDDMIPFNEYFVIPYILWFAYVAIAVIFFLFFAPRTEFYKFTGFLFAGMTICLIIYSIYPNGQALRVTEFPRDNIFTDLVRRFYRNDTPTNVCPSIHCFNSIAVTVAVLTSKKLTGKFLVKLFSIIMTIAIMLSTVFIKQHSFVDMVGAIILSILLFAIIYLPSYVKLSYKLTDSNKKKFILSAKN